MSRLDGWPAPPRQVLWHPHQKLWNTAVTTRLRRLPAGGGLAALVVLADSFLLVGRAVARRIRVLGPLAVLRPPAPPRRAVYVDCGLHKEAEELRAVLEWFRDGTELTVIGCEASPEHFKEVADRLRAVPGLRLWHAALVGPDHDSSTVRLYRAGGDGRGDSLFAARGESYDDVPAVRLSQVLAAEGIDVRHTPTVIRMNIEGAERYVIADLADAGLCGPVAGFYGMWDDLSKIDPEQDAAFRAELARLGVHPFTFNARDLRHSMRSWAIRYDIQTSLRRGRDMVEDHVTG